MSDAVPLIHREYSVHVRVEKAIYSSITTVGSYRQIRDLQRQTCKLVKKCLIKINIPQFLCNYFTFNGDVVLRIMRQCNCLRILQVRTEAAKRAFLFTMSLNL